MVTADDSPVAEPVTIPSVDAAPHAEPVENSEKAVEEKKPENAVEEKKPENAIEEKKPENAAEEKKPENAIEEKKPENAVEEKKPENAIDDKKPENAVEEKKPEVPAANPTNMQERTGSSQQTTPAPKKQWGDDDYEDEPDLSFDSLKVSTNDGGDVDKPEITLKSATLNESVEAPETEIRKVLAENTPYTSAKTFEELNLSESLLRGIYSEMKFEKPSRIQAETLPLMLTPPYQNLIAQAHNGSGKTTCFVLGMLSRVDPSIKAPQAVCVCPTRELVNQNEEVLVKMSKYTGITSASTASAESGLSVSASRRGQITDQVIIGTPGTLKRWMTKDKILSTNHIKVLVFDEADHMLDQYGFQDDSMRIINNIKQTKGRCQILLFSATFSTKVKAFALRIVPQANYIFVEKEKLSLDVIKQYRVRCPDVYAKVDVIKDRIFPAAERLGQSIIFVRTRLSANDLHKTLEADGFKCTSIQGGLPHEDRDRVIKEFRSGETKILISTDVLARGFDQAQVTLVVNYDIPLKSRDSGQPEEPDFELYLHRIGRSGRFGRKGAAFNLCANNNDERNVDLIARHFDRNIPEVPWDDDDAFESVLKDAGLA